MRLELGRYDTQGYLLRGTHVITRFHVLARFDTWSEFYQPAIAISRCYFREHIFYARFRHYVMRRSSSAVAATGPGRSVYCSMVCQGIDEIINLGFGG